MTAENEAQDLLARHGTRASQLVLDEIVAAIKRGDQIEADRRGKVLQALDLARLSAPTSPVASAVEEIASENERLYDASPIRGIMFASTAALGILVCAGATLLVIRLISRL